MSDGAPCPTGATFLELGLGKHTKLTALLEGACAALLISGCGGRAIENGNASSAGSSNRDGASGAPSAGAASGGATSVSANCVGLASTCGPDGNGDCCESPIVQGGAFYRSYDAAANTDKSYPATVSDFRLDKYEITVGRFRRFVAAYRQDMIAEGAGKNPNDSQDSGWDSQWNAKLEASVAELTAALKCRLPDQTWTDSAGSPQAESLPIGCLGWYDAEAFCIWDGGRLPTEAEWNYAASGGMEQRIYPWGSATPDASYSVYGDRSALPVGSTPKGNGKWGHADLAGNIWEWVEDWYATYQVPCDDCAELSVTSERAFRGSGIASGVALLPNSLRFKTIPAYHLPAFGARCARAVQ